MIPLAEKIGVMLAAYSGDPVQVSRDGKSHWTDCPEPKWDWGAFTYRIKPTPRELWVNEYPSGTCSGHATKERAIAAKSSATLRPPVLYREVIE